jgi:hypothetical protein
MESKMASPWSSTDFIVTTTPTVDGRQARNIWALSPAK